MVNRLCALWPKSYQRGCLGIEEPLERRLLKGGEASS